MSEVTVIETEIFKFLDLRNVVDATGDQLDIIGAIVGADRAGRIDADYRNAIFVEISVNNTGGQHTALHELIDVLTTATVIDITEVFPAALSIFINESDVSIDVINSLRRAIAATVSYNFTFTSGAEPFAFDGGIGLGFGSLFSGAGGEFVSTIFVS